jgi:serine/threonine-protein phosphatase 2A activator
MATYKKPTRGIYVLEDLKQFVASGTYAEVVKFIRQIVLEVKGKENIIKSEESNDSVSKSIQNIYDLLKYTFDNVQKFPPEQTNNRFGNKSYRVWHEQTLLKDGAVQLAKLCSSNREAVLELLPYYYDSFGNSTRIDFGTGHEVNFILFLLCLYKIEYIKDSDLSSIGTYLFPYYTFIVNSLIKTYNLEPAGSHGVWSLDDYHFLPFLFGSSQLIGHKFIKPKSIKYQETIEGYKNKFMYLGSIVNILTLKSGPFKEHSHILYEVSQNVKSWGDVCDGLFRMFEVEVLGKVPVMQHLVFGNLIPCTWKFKASDSVKINPFGQLNNGVKHNYVGNTALARYFMVSRNNSNKMKKGITLVDNNNNPNTMLKNTCVPQLPSSSSIQVPSNYQLLQNNSGISIHNNEWIITSNKDIITDEETFLTKMKNVINIDFAPPEMFFGENYVMFNHVPSGKRFVFSALYALKGVQIQFDSNGVPDRKIFKHTDAAVWEKRADHNVIIKKNVQTDFDWTYTTYYSGHFVDENNKYVKNIVCEPTDQYQINYEKLKLKEPILWYDVVDLFEAELDDNGNGKLEVKVRVMPSCFFSLQRLWLRVDSMLIRVIDTRVYHEFTSHIKDNNKQTLIFEKSLREITFDELKQLGMSINNRDYTKPEIFIEKLPILKKWNEVVYL